MTNQYSRRSFLAGVVATGLATAGTIFVLPGGRSRTDSDTGQLRLWTGTDLTGARTAIVDMWNEANPDATVVTGIVPGGSRGEHDGMVDRIRNGAADIVNLDVIDIREFAKKGYIRDVSLPARTYFRAVEKMHQVSPGADRYWAVPFNSDVGMLFSRASAGLDLGQPLLPQAIRRAGGRARFVGQLAPENENQTEPFVVNVLEHALAGNPMIIDESGNLSTELVAWQNALTPLRNAILHADIVRAHNEDESRTRFESGLSYMRNWPAHFRQLRNPVGVDVLPLGPSQPSGAGAGILGGQSLALVAGARNVDTATRFIEFATSEAAQRVAAAYGLAPALPGVYDDQTLRQSMPHLDNVKSALERARPRPVHSHYREFATALRTHVLPFLTDANAALQATFIDEVMAALDPGEK